MKPVSLFPLLTSADAFSEDAIETLCAEAHNHGASPTISCRKNGFSTCPLPESTFDAPHPIFGLPSTIMEIPSRHSKPIALSAV